MSCLKLKRSAPEVSALQTSALAFGALLLVLIFASPTLASICGSAVYSVSASNDLLTERDPSDASEYGSVTMTLAGETILGAHALSTGFFGKALFVLLDLQGHTHSFLGFVNPLTGVVDPVGSTGLRLSTMAEVGGTVYAMTDANETPAETLFTLDLGDGSATVVCALEAGDFGKAIAFNLSDGLLWHISGSGGPYDPIADTGLATQGVDLFSVPCDTFDIAVPPLVSDDVCEAVTILDSGAVIWKKGIGPGSVYVFDAFDGSISGSSATATDISGLASLPICSFVEFMRGDVNYDGLTNIADPITQLGYFFTPPTSPYLPCLDASDANDDGLIDISDTIAILSSLFLSPAVPLPFPYLECGFDPTDFDTLDCEIYDACP